MYEVSLVYYSGLSRGSCLLARLFSKPDPSILEPDFHVCFCQLERGSQLAAFLSSHVLLSGECAF